MVLGVVGNFAGFLSYKAAEADLIARRPELAQLQDDWNRIELWMEVQKAYRAEFPLGWKVQLSWILSIVALVSLFSGGVVLAEFK